MQQISPEIRLHFQQVNELISQLLRLLSEKERFVIERRFNLDKTRPYTLEEIGKHFRVTRERVRQIEKSALQKLRRNVFTTLLPSLFSFAQEFLKEHGGVLRQDIFFSKLIKEVLGSQSVHIEALALSLELDATFAVVGNTIQLHPYIRLQDISPELTQDVCASAERILNEHADILKGEDLYQKLMKIYAGKNEVTPIFIQSILQLDKRIKVLDDAYGLFEWRHIHPRTLRDKIFFILRQLKKPLHFVELANLIMDGRFDQKRVNVQAVHNELIRCSDFILIGRGIYALKEWGYEKGTVTDVIENILKKNGEMDQEDIVSEVLKKRQVKRITILLALKNSKKYERTGRKRHRLVRK